MLKYKLPMNNNNLKIKIIKSKNLPINKYGYNLKLDKSLKKIETIDNKEWVIYRDLTNDFEFIGINNKQLLDLKKLTKVDIKLLIKFKPLSRAYFKLWEIIHEFEVIPKIKNCTNVCLMSGNLAEAPGGWINAIIDYQKKYHYENLSKDKLIAISLKESLKFKIKENNYLKKYNQQIEINLGTGDGDLTNPKNIKEYKKRFINNKAHLVTADGGIGIEKYDIKEYLNSKLIFSEVLTALNIQKKKGNFVLKIYSIYTDITIQIINILQIFYQTVNIVKPVTSRPANDELYLVCLNFKGITNTDLNKLFNVLDEWNKLKKGQYLINFLDKSLYVDKISKFNKLYLERQVKNIDKVFKFMKLNQKEMKSQLDKMYNYAKIWYKKYNINLE